MQQDEIFREIKLERAEQDLAHGRAVDASHTANDWIAIGSRHLGLAANDGGAEDGKRFRRQMIRLAALCVAAVENYDRDQEWRTEE